MADAALQINPRRSTSLVEPIDDKIDLSLTDFIDFAIKSGTPKLSKVREIKGRGPYHPATDYWKPLREYLRDLHEAGTFDKQALKRFAESYNDPKKVTRYRPACAGYLKFLGRRESRWFKPPHGTWSPNRLRIRINPELGLVIASTPHVIKLYFKSERLSKQRVDLLTFLMSRQLGASLPECGFAVLEVNSGKLFNSREGGIDLMPLLLGEAASFEAIWDSLTPG